MMPMNRYETLIDEARIRYRPAASRLRLRLRHWSVLSLFLHAPCGIPPRRLHARRCGLTVCH
jgi:hypothetical protein